MKCSEFKEAFVSLLPTQNHQHQEIISTLVCLSQTSPLLVVIGKVGCWNIIESLAERLGCLQNIWNSYWIKLRKYSEQIISVLCHHFETNETKKLSQFLLRHCSHWHQPSLLPSSAFVQEKTYAAATIATVESVLLASEWALDQHILFVKFRLYEKLVNKQVASSDS